MRFSFSGFKFFVGCLLVLFPSYIFAADCSSTKLTKTDYLVVGERSVSVMYHLGVIPDSWSGRKSLWSKSKELNSCSDFLGCPVGFLGTKRDKAKEAVKKYQKKPILITKSDPVCLYIPNLKSAKFTERVAKYGGTPHIIDFTSGIEKPLMELGKLFDKEEKAKKEIDKYHQLMKRVDLKSKKVKTGLKVAVLSGIYQKETGHSFLRVELDGGYTDKFLLNRFNAENIAKKLFNKEELKNVDKGHITIRSSKLKDIINLKPDVIVAVDDSFVVEQYIYSLKLDKNIKVLSLPRYFDCDPVEYPRVLLKWAVALALV